jgi:hypothetical protein
MSLRDSFAGTVQPRDVLLYEVPGGTVAYRVIQLPMPTESDFRSHYEVGMKPNPTRAYRSYAWFGVSHNLQASNLDRLVQTQRSNGGNPHIAERELPDNSGLYAAYNARTHHLEVFGTPPQLRELVRHIFRP